MEQAKINNAAETYSTHNKSPVGSHLHIHKCDAFKAGAKWQKDEDEEILKALSTVYNEYMQSTKKDGKKPNMVTVTLNFQTMQHVATILNKHL
jgi:hypothetical protein